MFGISAFVWIFIICDVGNEVTTHFSSIDDAIYECAWYKLPLNLKKYIPFMMMIAQKPIYIQSMGYIRCTRETFRMVNEL